MDVFGGKMGDRVVQCWPPNELVLTFGFFYVCANFGENRSRNATVRVLADGHTDTRTHVHTQTQIGFIICPMLYAIAMGQIINKFIIPRTLLQLNLLNCADLDVGNKLQSTHQVNKARILPVSILGQEPLRLFIQNSSWTHNSKVMSVRK